MSYLGKEYTPAALENGSKLGVAGGDGQTATYCRPRWLLLPRPHLSPAVETQGLVDPAAFVTTYSEGS